MEVVIVNKKETKLKLNDAVWKAEFNSDVVAQAVGVYLSNQRKGSSKAKRKGEVDGGGRKPWRQKGTGRARAGSIRSPLWVGGGATFAPTGEQNFSKKINKKTNSIAIKMTVSKQVAQDNVKFVEFEQGKEKTAYRNELKELLKDGKKALLISDNADVLLALRNNKSVSILKPQNINVYDVAKVSNIIIDSAAVESLEKILKA